VVLGGGSLPLDVLEARVVAWIAAEKARAARTRGLDVTPPRPAG
jgi:hypothetical protein